VSHWFGQTNLHAFKVKPSSKNDLFLLQANLDGSFSLVSQVNSLLICVMPNNQTSSYILQTNDCSQSAASDSIKFELILNEMDASFSLLSRTNGKYVSASDLDPLQAMFDSNLNECHFYLEKYLNPSFSTSTSTSTRTSTSTSTTSKTSLNIITVIIPTNGDVLNNNGTSISASTSTSTTSKTSLNIVIVTQPTNGDVLNNNVSTVAPIDGKINNKKNDF